MSFKSLEVSLENHIAHIKLNRPDALNSMNIDFWQELPVAVREIDPNTQDFFGVGYRDFVGEIRMADTLALGRVFKRLQAIGGNHIAHCGPLGKVGRQGNHASVRDRSVKGFVVGKVGGKAH